MTDAVGFRFRWDDPTKQFVHASGIMVATPDGKLSRYFYGIQYAPQDLRMALVDASKHKIGSPVDYVLLFCFHYDPSQGRYTLAIINVLKIAAHGDPAGPGRTDLLPHAQRQRKESDAHVELDLPPMLTGLIWAHPLWRPFRCFRRSPRSRR